MGAIPSGKGGEHFTPLPPLPQNAGFGGDLGGAAAGGDPGRALVGVE